MKKTWTLLVLLTWAVFALPACSKKKLESTTTQVQPIKPIDPADRLKPDADGFMPHQPRPDDPNYDERKREWVEKFPEEYQAYANLNAPPNTAPAPNPGDASGQNQSQNQGEIRSPDMIIIKRSVFNQAPPDKQQYILAHPELYQIVED